MQGQKGQSFEARSITISFYLSFLSQILSMSTGPRHPEHKVGPKQNIVCVQEATKIAPVSSVKGI